MSIGYIPKKRRITRRLRLLRKKHNRMQKNSQKTSNTVYIPNVTNARKHNENSKSTSINNKNKFKLKNLFSGIFQIGNQY